MLPEAYAIVKDQVAFCGIHCGECPLGNGNVAKSAIDLKGYLQMYDVPSWAHEMPGGKDIDFKVLDQNLLWVEKWLGCPGCLKGGGNPECPIRLCSKVKGFPSCGNCAELKGCDKFDWLGKKGEMLKMELAENK